MSVVFVPQRTRISVDRYQKMVAAGVLTKYDRIELIDGEMIDMAPIGSQHASLSARLTKLFVLAVGDEATVFTAGPVNLGDFSEPQPDVMVLRPRADDYAGQIPTQSDVLLIVEISDSSLAYDQGTKRALYARHGVVEYWIVDVEGRRIQVHREPTRAGYAQIREVGAARVAGEIGGADRIAPLALPDVEVVVGKLFP